MSKAIRIKDYLYEEIQRRAEEERRPLITQLEMLLEQALRINVSADAQPRDVVTRSEAGLSPGADQSKKSFPQPPASDVHFKPDFKK